MPPSKHAVLGASSAERWLNCTASVKASLDIPSKTSSYAEEGTVAHELCELYARLALGMPTELREREIKKSEYYNTEMMECANTYKDYILERMGHYIDPFIDFEVRVDYSHIAPEGFGTSDAVIIGTDRETNELCVEIIDYKHGKGVPKYAPGNPQMRLYALGAAAKYSFIYGDFEKVRMTIFQPRLDSVSFDEMLMDELNKWANDIVRPAAKAAFTGEGSTFKQGSWCRFCPIKATCRERAGYYTSIEDDFKDITTQEYRSPDTLSDDEIGHILERLGSIKNYITDVEEYVFAKILGGEPVAGWKIVEGRSIRVFNDMDGAFEAVKKEGFDEALLYERKPLSLSALEKLVGKKRFNEICGNYIDKPAGKPTLAPESDKRPAMDQAADDFKDIEA